MPYDEALAERVRRALAGTQDLTEKKMFGGIAFMVNGAMCVRFRARLVHEGGKAAKTREKTRRSQGWEDTTARLA